MTKHSIDPRDTDGGITAAAIEKETERSEAHPRDSSASEWKILAEAYGRALDTALDRDEKAEHMAALWKEAARRAIRHAERKDEALDAWRTRALDAEERERILIAERARRGEVCPDKDAHWRLDEALEDCDRWRIEAQEAANDYLHARRQLEDAAKTIRELRGQLVEQETRGFTAEDPADAAVRWMIRAKEEQHRAEKAEARIQAVRDVLDSIDTSAEPALHDGFADIHRDQMQENT